MDNVKLGGGYAWLVWVLAVAFVLYLFNIQTGYSIINESVRESLGLSLQQMGIIASVYTWAFAIFQLFGGALLDRLGARKILLPAIALVTLGIYIFSISTSFEMLLLSQVILALGGCVGFVGAGYVGGHWFGFAKFGVMFGFVQVAAALFSAFGQSGVTFALEHYSWEQIAMGAAYLGIGLFLLAFLFVKDPAPIPKSEHPLVGDLFHKIVQVLKIPHVWVASAWGAISFGLQLALGVVWAPKILIAHSVDSQEAYYAAATIWFGLAVGSLFWNKWSDMTRSRKIPAIVGMVIMLLSFLGLLYLPLTATLGMALCFIYGVANAGHMIAFATAADVVKPEEIGTSAAVVNGIMFIVGGIFISVPGERLAGTVADVAAFQHAFLPATIAMVIGLVLSVIQKETHP